MNKPLLSITLGDPTGCGPETILGAWRHATVHDGCRPFVVGHPEILRRAARLFAPEVEVRLIDRPADALPSPALLPCLPCGADDVLEAHPGQVDSRAGEAAYQALLLATQLALAKEIDGIVTAPLHKAAWWQAGRHYPGHTEALAELCGVRDFAMMLYLAHGETIRGKAGLGVIHVTLHVALAEVFARLSIESIYAKIKLAATSLAPLVGGPPRLGVCALNPHAGESGLFGHEETSIIAPAIAQAVGEGVDAQGPFPTDTLMVRARDGEFDGVVAMYHDQGHIALKLLGMHRAVNITLGLPIVRTSVAHGVAHDLAWQGRADCGSMVEAIRVAALLTRLNASG